MIIGKTLSQRKSSALSQTLNIINRDLESNKELIILESKGLCVRHAESRADLKKVFELRYNVYLEKGYALNNESKLDVTSFDAKLNTLILLVANAKNEVVGSMSLYYDDFNFLPADTIFKDELNLLRKEGVKFVEVSKFVVRHDYQNQKEIILSLINTSFIHSFRIMNFDSFIIEVNPHHVVFYRRLLGFEQLGEIKECPRVNNAPAVLLICSKDKYLNAIDKGIFEKRSLYNYFLNKEIEHSIIAKLKTKTAMNYMDKKYFGVN